MTKALEDGILEFFTTGLYEEEKHGRRKRISCQLVLACDVDLAWRGEIFFLFDFNQTFGNITWSCQAERCQR